MSHRPLRLAALVSAMLVLTASERAEAQYCPSFPIPRNSCDPLLQGNPVHAARGTSYYTQRDLSLRLPVGTFTLDRYFVSNSAAWVDWGNSTQVTDLKGPYGKGLQGAGLRWWNSLHSLVYQPGGTYVYVRERSGALSEFYNECPGSVVACWLPHSGQAPAVPGHLRRDADGGYHLTTESGETLTYGQARPIPNGSPPVQFYLSAAVTPAGEQLFSVQYFAETDAGVVPGCQSSDRGVPFIESVNFLPSSPEQLRFFYSLNQLPDAGNPQCLLQRIEHWESSSGPSTPLVQYEYGLFDNGAGLTHELSTVIGAPDAGAREAYAYGTPAAPVFQRLSATSPTVTQFLADAGTYLVVGSTGGGPQRLSVTSVSQPQSGGQLFCPAGTCCSETSSATLTEVVEAFQDGGVAKKTSFFSVMNLGKFSHQLELFKRTEDSVGDAGANVSTGTVEWYRLDPAGTTVCSATVPSPLWAVKNKLGFFSVTPHRSIVPATGPLTTSVIELAGERRGATTPTGGGALESVDYAYVYGPREDRHLSEKSRVSLIQDGGVASTTYKYNLTTSRLEAVVDTGWTQNFDAGVPEQKFRATFHKLSRACDTDTTADPYDRALRIEGPCYVSSGAATSCTGEFPVTEFTYFSTATTGSNRAGRLRFVKRYPNNSGGTCGTALTTEYTGYTATGLPTEIIDESGATVAFQYAGDKLVKRTQVVSGVTRATVFTYEGDRLVRVTQPRLNSEIFCYRSGASSTCTGGTPTRLLRWRAKFDATMAWTERIDYEYWPVDETLQSETHSINVAGSASERLKRTYERDAHQRLVMDAVGNAGSLPRTRRAYDANDNLTRIGTSFAGAQPFCATNPESCAWLGYDRADRQVQLDLFPDAPATTNQKRTCINYGSNGDVRRVVPGCDGTTACNTSGGTDSCNAGWTDYETDDFGNLVTITYPWTHDASARGRLRFDYDALGNVTKKQSSEMAFQGYFLSYTHDSLGRLLKLERQNVSGGSPILLYALKYDGTETIESGCPSPSFGGGRLTAREDSFGVTRYLYDSAGAVTKEVRRRYGLSGCTGDTAQDKNPHTTYTYTDNGELKQIIYPHGRTVNYAYPTTGAMDRPTSISYTSWVSGAWSTAATAIDSIWWEPYAGLRSYRLTTGAGAGQWVEYFRGASVETAPTAGSCSNLSVSEPNDQSGRLRGVFVSDGTYAPGSPNGNIFKQVYTWNGDQLVQQQTCHRNGGNPSIESYGYDKTTRLTSHNDPLTGPSTFTYDRRDTRVAATVPGPSTCNLATDFWTAAWQVDLLFSNRWGSAFGTTCSANGKYNYWYDRDGRRTSTWDEYDKYHVTTSFVSSQASGGTGLESVYQTAVVAASNYLSDSFGGGTYSYFYDSLGRRRAKTTPWSSTDEYFYDLGHQMLSDRGANAIGGSSTTFPEDDYIWLGGRPVLLVRGQMSASTWARQAETTSTWCQRNGEYLVCGERPIVTDYLGKPVLMLDRGGTAYTATYEAFGYANRHEYRVGSPHYVVGSSNVATIAPPVQSGFDATLRFLTSRSNFSIFSSVTVNGQTEAALQGDRSHTWTTWRTNGSSTWTIAWNGSSPDYGFDVEAYELKVKQIGTVWASTPLRFPGQYFDAETELHENFNRYFDPSSGRYLSPEPLLQDPKYVKEEAEDGFSVPTYAYARNNPIRYTDPTGLFSWIGECQGAGVSVSAVLNHEGGQEGVRGRTTQPALTIDPLPSSVQFTSPGTSACQDADSARAIQVRYLQAYGPVVTRCWRLMIRQMDEACKLEGGPPLGPPPAKPGRKLTCER